MGRESHDLAGRIASFLETFGAEGGMFLIIGLVLAVGVAFWRGAGFVLFLLMLSYAFGPIQEGGVIFAATLIRWSCFGLLLLVCIRDFQAPNRTMYLYLFYTMCGLIFFVNSPAPLWTIQKGCLRLMMALSIPLAVTTYVSSTADVARLFKIIIFTAAVWIVISLSFFQSYAQSEVLRFKLGGESALAVDAGAYLAPILVWGIVQSRRKKLRICSAVLIVPFIMLLLLSGKRTAFAGQLIIGSAPLLLLGKNPLKLIGFLVAGAIFAASSVFVMFQLVPHRAGPLIERFASRGITERGALWEYGMQLCLRSPVMGHGEGAADAAGAIVGHGFHNGYLIAWYNSGMLGLCALVLFLLAYTIKAWRLYRRAQTDEMADFARLAFGYLLAVIAVAFFVGSIGGVANITNCMLLIMCALIDRLGTMTATQPRPQQAMGTPPLLSHYGVQPSLHYHTR